LIENGIVSLGIDELRSFPTLPVNGCSVIHENGEI
jgi:hypothetical protein